MEGKDPHDCAAHPVCRMLTSTQPRFASSNCPASMVSPGFFDFYSMTAPLVLFRPSVASDFCSNDAMLVVCYWFSSIEAFGLKFAEINMQHMNFNVQT
jgi:hypothetical protein